MKSDLEITFTLRLYHGVIDYLAEYPYNSSMDNILSSAAKLVIDEQSAAAPLLQRQLKIGYARAQAVIDELESIGIIEKRTPGKHKVLIAKVGDLTAKQLKKLPRITEKSSSPTKKKSKNSATTTTPPPQINFSKVVYAEYAESGAMGCRGCATVYVLDDGEVQSFSADISRDEGMYMQIVEGVRNRGELFDYCYVGFGNHAFIRRYINLAVDEKGEKFIFHYDGRRIPITASVKGVFDRVAKFLLQRQAKISELYSARFLRKHPITEPILDHYFGEIGFGYFLQSNDVGFRLLKKPRNGMFGQDENHRLSGAIQALDRLSPFSLIRENITDELSDAKESPDFSIDMFIYDRPYYYLFLDSESLEFAKLILEYLCGKNITSDHSKSSVWADAVIYIKYLDKRVFNLNGEQIENGKYALRVFRLLYLLERLGRNGLEAAMNEYFHPDNFTKHIGNFHHFLSGKLDGERIEEIFTTPAEVAAESFKLDEKGIEYLRSLWSKPVVVHFSDKMDVTIIQAILDDTLPADITNLYINNYDKILDKKPYSKIYPALKHVATNTEDYNTLYMVGDMLNNIWKALPDDDALQARFRKELHEIYWPRVESVWVIKNLQNISFVEDPDVISFPQAEGAEHFDTRKAIISDAITWVMCLEDIAELNPEIAEYLRVLDKEPLDHLSESVCQPVWKRVFDDRFGSNSNSTARQTFNAILDYCSGDNILRLAYPDSVEEAEVLLDDIFTGDEIIKRCGSRVFLPVLEHLSLNSNKKDIRVYVLQRFVDDFDKLVSILDQYCDDSSLKHSHLIALFTASCAGATSIDERSLLESFSKKILSLKVDAVQKTKTTTYTSNALKAAEQNIKMSEFQQADLAKSLFHA